MPHDPVRITETTAWLRRAASDLRAATHELAADPPILDDLVFHCQQAVEKSMKAFLAWHDRAFRKTHNLEEIGEACLSIDSSLKAIVDRAVPLTEYAWRFRYPGEPESPTQDEAQEALETAWAAYRALLDRLPAEVRAQLPGIAPGEEPSPPPSPPDA